MTNIKPKIEENGEQTCAGTGCQYYLDPQKERPHGCWQSRIEGPCIPALIRKCDELHAELARVQRLPDQEWAEVGAIILQVLAAAARAGYAVKDSDAVAAIDRGMVYVDRILAERDAALARVAQCPETKAAQGGAIQRCLNKKGPK